MNNIISKIKFKGVELFYNVLYASRLKKHEIPNDKKLILCYHGIDLVGNTKLNSKFISREYFEKQLIFFKKNFNIVSLEEFFKIKDACAFSFALHITFDDGYKNNIKYVLPLIEKYEIPVSFFLTGINETEEDMLWADFFDLAAHFYNKPISIDGVVFRKNIRGHFTREGDGAFLKDIFHDGDFDYKKRLSEIFPNSIYKFKDDPNYHDYWQQMSNEDIRELSSLKLVSIGSHGFYHNDLSKIPIEDAVNEIKKSRLYLENLIQSEILDIAFPSGNYTPQLLNECKNLGFKRMLSLEYLFENKDNALHDRFGISSSTPWNAQLHYLLKGDYA